MKTKIVRLTVTQIAFLISMLEGVETSQGDEADAIIEQLRKAEAH